MKRSIYLHGALGERFGRHHRLAVVTPAEAVRALCVLHPGFRRDLAAGAWRVVTRSGRRFTGIDRGLLDWRLGEALHIVPAAAGSGRGAGKIVLGAVLIGAAFAFAPAAAAAGAGAGAAAGGAAAGGLGATAFTVFGATISYANIAMFGVSMVLSGVSQMLAPRPRSPGGGATAAEQRPSYLLTGPQNVATQGIAVPLAYGECEIGSVLISAGIVAEEWGTASADFPWVGSAGVLESGVT